MFALDLSTYVGSRFIQDLDQTCLPMFALDLSTYVESRFTQDLDLSAYVCSRRVRWFTPVLGLFKLRFLNRSNRLLTWKYQVKLI